jgi:hypothetical protein
MLNPEPIHLHASFALAPLLQASSMLETDENDETSALEERAVPDEYDELPASKNGPPPSTAILSNAEASSSNTGGHPRKDKEGSPMRNQTRLKLRLKLSLPVALPAKNLTRKHRNRKKKRNAVVEKSGHAIRPSVLNKLAASSISIPTSCNAQTLPVSSGGYTAAPARKIRGAKAQYTIQKGLGCGLQFIRWDGQYVPI